MRIIPFTLSAPENQEDSERMEKSQSEKPAERNLPGENRLNVNDSPGQYGSASSDDEIADSIINREARSISNDGRN